MNYEKINSILYVCRIILTTFAALEFAWFSGAYFERGHRKIMILYAAMSVWMILSSRLPK